MSDTILAEVNGPIAQLTLNQPDRLNALSEEMLDHLAKRVDELSGQPHVRVIAITGAGRGFCSGADLRGNSADGSPIDAGTLYAAGRAVRAITGSPKPVVALVNGVAAGVGCSLALAADYVLAAESAYFVLPFGTIGLMPDGGATALVAASVGRARAMRMALTAEKVTAATAHEWGLIAEVVADTAFPNRSQGVMDILAASSGEAVAWTKRAINAATIDLDRVLSREEQGQAILLAGADFAEGVAAFNARRPPSFGRA